MIQKIRILSLVTLIGMPLVALFLSFIFDLDFNLKLWFIPENWLYQLWVGVAYGLVIGIMASWITEREFMDKVKVKYAEMFSRLNLTWYDVVFISLCAGIGEEILFRFAVQKLTGIWIAAIIFVAVHGYLDPRNWRMSVYGVFMVLASAGFGYLTLKFGLLSAIIAHAVVDIYLLSIIKMENKKATFDFRDDRNEEH